jgi:hypothetical protein
MRGRGRQTKRDHILALNAADRFYAGMAGKEPLFQQPVPKQRTPRAIRPSGIPLERDVIKAVVKILRYDHRVSRVERNQSGVFQDGNRYIRVGMKGKLDLTVYLKSGRYIEIEVKRPGAKPAPHQAARIAEIRAQGGLAGYCWSVESALALLP